MPPLPVPPYPHLPPHLVLSLSTPNPLLLPVPLATLVTTLDPMGPMPLLQLPTLLLLPPLENNAME